MTPPSGAGRTSLERKPGLSQPLHRAADLALRSWERAHGGLRTMAARHVAVLDPSARIGASGRVNNIRGVREAIRIGERSFIAGELTTYAHGGRIAIGDWCFIGRGSMIWSAAEVVIGSRVLISHHVNVHDTDGHPMDAAERFEQTRAILTTGHPRELPALRSAPIHIGDDAWIGFGAMIFKGVTIGARSIIGAGAIVRSDVPPDAIVKPNETPSAGRSPQGSGAPTALHPPSAA
jgi:acetyltransferase-like isoleucine patch superfamily enzyme